MFVDLYKVKKKKKKESESIKIKLIITANDAILLSLYVKSLIVLVTFT